VKANCSKKNRDKNTTSASTTSQPKKINSTRKKQEQQKNNPHLSKEQAKTLTHCYAYSSFL